MLFTSISRDSILIRPALMQVGQYIRLNVQFIAGFAIAFSKGWLLTLVLLAVTPALVLAGGIMTFSITRLAARGLESYAQAGSLAEQVTPFVTRLCCSCCQPVETGCMEGGYPHLLSSVRSLSRERRTCLSFRPPDASSSMAIHAGVPFPVAPFC
jgi:ABC-type multidrug transport system fused ATPase/permease subunit